MLDYANTGDSTMISRSGNLTVVVATVGNVQEKQAVTALEKAIAAQTSLKGNVWLGGPTTADVQIAAVSSQDLGRAELFALPFLIVLLFFVFRGIRAASMPLIGAIFAIAVTLGIMGLVMVALPLSVFALNLVIALGLGLSVDFSLLSSRASVKSSTGRARPKLPSSPCAGPQAGRCSSALSPSPPQWRPSPSSPSASCTPWGSRVPSSFFRLVPSRCSCLPSLLTIYGDRIAAPGPVRRHGQAAGDGGQATGRWYRIATVVMRRPALWGLSALLVLLVLAAPFLHVAFTGADASSLPASSSAGTAYELVQTKFGAFSEAPASLIVNASQATLSDLASVATEADHVDGVKAVSNFQHLGGSLWEANVALSSAPLSPAAQQTVNDLQTLRSPGQITVVGQTASFLSLQDSLKSHLPVVLGLIILIALVMLFAMTRSVVLPVMAVVMNILTVGATFGMLVWVFQWGHLRHLLGFSGPGALQSTSLIIILAVVFGLSTDYGVFLLGRMKEEHDSGATPDQAVALGLDRTGGIVSAAALCLALAMGALVLPDSSSSRNWAWAWPLPCSSTRRSSGPSWCPQQ